MIAGGAMLSTLLGSCGLGYAISAAGGVGAVAAVRDLSIMFLSLFWLITTLIVGVIGFGGAWALGRFGGKAVTGLGWVGRKVARAEGLVEGGLDRAVVRPLGKSARALASAKTFVSASMKGSDSAAAWGRQRDVAVRTVSSLVRQARNNPMGRAEH